MEIKYFLSIGISLREQGFAYLEEDIRQLLKIFAVEEAKYNKEKMESKL